MTTAGPARGDREPSLAELRAEADHARDKIALYRRKLYAGRGDMRRLAELEREAAGASGRLTRAREREA